MIRTLCKRYTNLNEKEIGVLYKLKSFLPMIEQVTGGDVFIDCMTKDDGIGIVVAEARKRKNSLYKKTVVGAFVKRENEPAAIRSLDTGRSTIQVKGISQENIPIEQTVTAIKCDGKVIGVLIVEKDASKDFTDQKNLKILSETMQQLTQQVFGQKGEISNDKQNFITDYLTDGILIFADEEAHVIYANAVAEKIYKKLGYIDDIVGMSFENLVLDDIKLKELRKKKYMETPDLEIGNLSLNIKYSFINYNKSEEKLLVLMRDTTELKKQEKELISKSVAIREIHHRVKNNLQTIASLLRMQSRRLEDEYTKKAFTESINRVLSIAVTHELLSQNGVDDVDIKEIITNVVRNNIYCNINPNLEVKPDIVGDNFSINSEIATSIALVVNELVQNCLEYAFVGRDKGNIKISISKDEIHSIIVIEDDGVGFDKNLRKKTSLGLNIVEGIIKEKLYGQMKIESSNTGTKITLEILN